MIGIQLHKILKNHQPLSDLVGENVSPVITEQGIEPPFVMYDIEVMAEHCKSKTSYFPVNVVLVVMACSYQEGQEIMNVIREKLDFFFMTDYKMQLDFKYQGEKSKYDGLANIYHNEIKFLCDVRKIT